MKVLKGYSHGINLGGWLSQCVSYDKDHFDNFILEDDIKYIASLGMDHLRLPIDYDVIEEEDGTTKEEGMQHIEDCINWCKKYNLNVVMDLHKTFGYMFDSAVVSDPTVFFHDKALQDRFYSIWDKLTDRFAKYEDIVCFELLNEVVSDTIIKEWNEIAHTAIARIRAKAPTITIIMGGVNYNSVTSVPLLGAPVDENIVFNFHCYEPLVFTHQKAHWMPKIKKDLTMHYPDTIEKYREISDIEVPEQKEALQLETLKDMGPDFFRNLFAPAIETAKKYDVALYCGEYGCIDQAPVDDSIRWLKDIHSVFDEFGIGHAMWTYKAKDFGLMDPHYEEIKKLFEAGKI